MLQSAALEPLSFLTKDNQHPHYFAIQKQSALITMSLQKYGFGAVVTGGQTGTDRAAFKYGIDRDIPCLGFCPQGAIDENGHIPQEFAIRLREPDSAFCMPGSRDVFEERTNLNAWFSDATLVLNPGEPIGGTKLTIDFANRYGRPNLLLDLAETRVDIQRKRFQEFLIEHKPVLLNIAGPRQSHGASCGVDIEKSSYDLLRAICER